MKGSILIIIPLLKHQQKYLKLFLATLLIISIIAYSDRYYTTQTLAQEVTSTSFQQQFSS